MSGEIKQMRINSGIRRGFWMWLVLLCALVVSAAGSASTQSRGDLGRLGERMVDLKVGELTLESVNFRDQTARLSLGLDVKNGLLPVSLKDFDYSLRLFDRQLIEGSYDGTLKVGGRRASRVNLPLTVSLRSIPGVVWSAFSNRGQVRYDLDTAFTLPLFITEKRFSQNVAGEVPLRTLVDAATILRARSLSEGRTTGTTDRLGERIRERIGGWPF